MSAKNYHYKQFPFNIFRFGLQQISLRHWQMISWSTVTHSPERKRGGEKIGRILSFGQLHDWRIIWGQSKIPAGTQPFWLNLLVAALSLLSIWLFLFDNFIIWQIIWANQKSRRTPNRSDYLLYLFFSCQYDYQCPLQKQKCRNFNVRSWIAPKRNEINCFSTSIKVQILWEGYKICKNLPLLKNYLLTKVIHPK